MKKPPAPLRLSQQGYILISTIIMVLLITLLALAGISFNSTQTRIATNSKDYQIAMETAEATIRQVSENVASAAVNYCTATVAVALTNAKINTECVGTTDETPLWQQPGTTWLTVLPGGATYQGSSSTPGSYIVEMLPTTGSTDNQKTYNFPMRITVRASGAISATPQVMLQTIINVPMGK